MLYITAIELDEAPRPPRALRFPRSLRGEVLLDVGETGGTAHGFSLGSLGPKVAPSFDGQFDVVLGNPPWTRLREAEPQRGKKSTATATDTLASTFATIGKQALEAKGLSDLARQYKNPDKDPDLWFRLRSDEEPTTVLSTHDGLFVECKPVDNSHPVRSDYCDKGLLRFIVGDYAWAMQDALMVERSR